MGFLEFDRVHFIQLGLLSSGIGSETRVGGCWLACLVRASHAVQERSGRGGAESWSPAKLR